MREEYDHMTWHLNIFHCYSSTLRVRQSLDINTPRWECRSAQTNSISVFRRQIWSPRLRLLKRTAGASESCLDFNASSRLSSSITRSWIFLYSSIFRAVQAWMSSIIASAIATWGSCPQLSLLFRNSIEIQCRAIRFQFCHLVKAQTKINLSLKKKYILLLSKRGNIRMTFPRSLLWKIIKSTLLLITHNIRDISRLDYQFMPI